MKTDRIIHVLLGKANPARQNGVNRVVYELAHGQCKSGNCVKVWGITKKPIVNFEKRAFETKLFQDSRFQFNLSRKLKESIKEEPVGTIFHLHGGFLPQLYSVASHLKRSGHSYIYTPHGAFNAQAVKRSRLKKVVYISLFEKFIIRNAKYVHVIGKSEISGTKSIFGKSPRIELIPNGHKLYPTTFSKPRKQSDQIHFGFLGRLDIETKGIDILINGFVEFLKNGGKGMLHIGGDGKDSQLIKRLIKDQKIGKNVRLYGAIFGEEKDRFLSRLDYFCLTSRNEGLPGVVLESLALKIPCIVSPETNMDEFISDFNAGFNMMENTADCLANKLSEAARIRSTQLYTQQCENAIQLIEQKFQWADISTRLIQKFHEN